MSELASEETPKKHGRFLRVVSILCIIFGALTLIFCTLIIMSLSSLSSEAELAEFFFLDDSSLALFYVIDIVSNIPQGILFIACGIMGIRVSNGHGRAHSCEIMAIVLLGLAILSFLLMNALMGFRDFSFIDMFLSVALPVAFSIAARVEATSAYWRRAEQLRRHNDVEILSSDDLTIRHCYAEVDSHGIIGTIAIPANKVPKWLREQQELEKGDFVSAQFSLVDGALVFDTEDPRFDALLARYEASLGCEQAKIDAASQGARYLYGLYRFIMRDDSRLLMDWRDRLDDLEKIAVGNTNDVPNDFEELVANARNALQSMKRFYRQLSDACESISESEDASITKEDKRRFNALSRRATRYALDAGESAEYAMQIRSLLQSRIGAKQTEITTVLTIVATVCMTVSLITGWYGMNIEHMPEKYTVFIYPTIIVVCVIIVTAELVYFKRKKWF